MATPLGTIHHLLRGLGGVGPFQAGCGMNFLKHCTQVDEEIKIKPTIKSTTKKAWNEAQSMWARLVLQTQPISTILNNVV